MGTAAGKVVSTGAVAALIAEGFFDLGTEAYCTYECTKDPCAYPN